MDSAAVQHDQILQTKLLRPVAPAEAIRRPHLLAKLDSYLPGQVILVSAPAGYGKTTLVSQWIDTLPFPTVWLSLDKYDQDLKIFIAYFLAAVAQRFPEFGESSRALLLSPQPVPTSVVTDALISDLEELPEPLLVVLDDFHLVENSELEELFARVLRLMPPHLSLLLTCRAIPRLPLVSLRLRQQLGELTEADLRLNEAEAAQLLSAIAGRAVDADTAHVLETSTEGWVTALILAGLNLRNRSDREFLDRLDLMGTRPAVDYLAEEVIDQISPAMYDFFLRTSILTRFDAALCDAVMAASDVASPGRRVPAETMLRHIEASNLFLSVLDDEQHWYRYHALFKGYWSRRFEFELSLEEKTALYLAASAALEARGLISAAISHALAAGDPVMAARIAERHYTEAINDEDWNRVRRWVALLPASVMDRPGVLIMQAWVENFGWRIKAAADLARRACEALDQQGASIDGADARRIRAEAAILEAQLAQFNGDARSVDLAQAALDGLPAASLYPRSLGDLYWVLGKQHIGQTDAAIAAIEQRLATVGSGPFVITSRLMLARVGVHLFNGDLSALEVTARAYRELGEFHDNLFALGWTSLMLGMVAYERNDLPLAEQCFGEIIPMRNAINGKAVAEAYAGLFLTLLHSGRLDEAEEALDRFRTHLAETKTLVFIPIVESLHTRLSLARRRVTPGELPRVTRYDPPQVLMPKLCLLEIPQLTAVRTLLVDGSPKALQEALHLLTDVREMVERTYETRRQVEIHTLLALVWAGLGDEGVALDMLRRALAQGEPQGYVRSIVNAGPMLGPLLSKLRAHGEFVAYIDSLGAVLEDPSVVSGAALAMVLTNREMDVLERLALRQSNKEIAAAFFLSPLTVKRHTQSLFRKLGASNRREAVVIARQKGLSI